MQEAANEAGERKAEVASEQVSATERLSAAEERLTQLTREGKVGTDEYAQALNERDQALYAGQCLKIVPMIFYSEKNQLKKNHHKRTYLLLKHHFSKHLLRYPHLHYL